MIKKNANFCIFLSFCFISYLASIFASFEEESVYLSWQKDPLTTITIQWLSLNEESPDKIFYKKISDKEWSTTQGTHLPFPFSQCYQIHRVELNNLVPGTNYQFKLNSNSEDKIFSFSTLPSNLNVPIRFVEGGDMYDKLPLLEKMCRQAARTNPSFALVGGDIAYAVGKASGPQSIERWIDWIRNWNKTMVTEEGKMIPCIAAIGNHDIPGHFNQKPEDALIFSTLFPMPGPQIYNIFDISNYASIVLLDSSHANPIGGKQTKWLKNTLEARKNIPFIFAAYHVPAYPSYRNYDEEISKAIRYFWVPLFEENKISLVFEHHEHTFKRTYPLLNNKVHPNGIIYVGDGAWGIDRLRRPKKIRKLYYLAKSASLRHFFLVTLKNGQCDVAAIGENGKLIDQFTLIKNCKKDENHEQ